jgi:hypothetical protein
MWVSEGLAMFFETPDFSSTTWWRGIGNVNRVNLERWRRYVPNRPEDSLATLLCNDSRFRSSETAEEAYAESWALTYFLLRTQREEFVEYLKRLSEGKPMIESTARERIALFEQVFEGTLEEIDQAFVAYMARVR